VLLDAQNVDAGLGKKPCQASAAVHARALECIVGGGQRVHVPRHQLHTPKCMSHVEVQLRQGTATKGVTVVGGRPSARPLRRFQQQHRAIVRHPATSAAPDSGPQEAADGVLRNSSEVVRGVPLQSFHRRNAASCRSLL